MDDEKSAKYPGDRMVLRGSMRLVLRPRCEGGDERPVLLGTHWKTGAEVVLREFDPEDACFYRPGPAVEVMQEREEDIAHCADAYLYDPDAKDPPNRVGFTTSHPDYDHGCTVEVERFTCAVYPGERAREFRQVVVRGGSGFSLGQLARYNNWTEEDPRVTRDIWAERCARRAAEDAAEAKETAEDEAWFAAMSLPELEAEYERRRTPDVWDLPAERGLHRIKLVLPVRRQAALDAAWEALQARIKPGATLLVPAVPRIRRTDPWSIRQFGEWEPGSPAYLLHVVCPQWCPKETPIAERNYSVQTDEGRDSRGTRAELLAQWFDAGYETQDYPPIEVRRKFYERTRRYIINAPRAVVAGKTYYVTTPEFSSDVLVLDETMHLCRSKKVRELVVAAHRWHEGRKMVLDSIAYHEGLQESDERRGRLAGLRERLAAGDASKPAELAAVDYKVPSVPTLSVEEATKQREKFK
jgi:hypothetical protein